MAQTREERLQKKSEWAKKNPEKMRAYHRAWRAKNREKRRVQNREQYWKDPEKSRRYYRERAQKKRQFLWDYKEAHPCTHCGNSDPRCLDFHHRDPTTKFFTVGREGLIYPQKRVEEEIDKCDVLCANCHRVEEWKLKQEESSGQKTTS